MLYKLMFLLFALGCFQSIQTAQRRFNLEIHNLNCTKYTTRITQLNCSLKQLTTGRYGFDIDFEFDQDLDPETQLHILSYFTPLKGFKAVQFMNFKLKVCDILRDSVTLPFVKIILAEIRKTGNLPYESPLKGNFLYTMNNYTVDASFLPTYTPFLSYNLSMNFYEHEKLLGGLLVKGATVARS